MNKNQHDHHAHEHGHVHHNPIEHPDASSSEKSSKSNTTDLKDPVCGMTVTRQAAYQSVHMGSTFFFCGTKCKTKFDVNPMLYMSGNAEKSQMTSAAAGTIYTCPMHPEIRQDHAGNCPKCGMTLEPLLPELEEDENPELRDFQRRFWWTLPLTIIVTFLAMAGHRLKWFDMSVQSWGEFAC